MFDKTKIRLALLLALCFTPYSVRAVNLDSSFGNAGRVLTDLGQGTAFVGATEMVEQSDGKIVTLGSASTHFALTRFNGNGTPDLTFGKGGKVVLNLSENNFASKVLIDTNGKIVVVGSIGSPAYIFVARLNTNGTFDTTFSGDGWVKTDVDAAIAVYPASAIIDQSNRIVVAGSTSDGHGTSKAFIVRYKSDGALDTTYDSDGKSFPAMSLCSDVAMDGKGRFLLAGSNKGFNGSFSELVVARLNSNGSLDTSFAGTGLITDSSFTATSRLQVAVLNTGTIVATGESGGTARLFTQVRYLETGNRQRSFGSNGYARATLGELEPYSGYAASIASNGSLTIAAVTREPGANPPAPYRLRVARFYSNGTLYPAFGGDGIAELPQNPAGYISALMVQRDGRVLVSKGLTIARVRTNGELDTSWNGGIVTGAAGTDDRISRIAIDGSGRIVAAGMTYKGASASMVLARYLPNGRLDDSFGQAGKVFYSSADFPIAEEVLLDGSGRILIVGSLPGNGLDYLVVARFNSDGSLDSTFGQGGRVTYAKQNKATGNSYSLRAIGAALRSDGKIVVGMRGVVARLNSDGSPDTRFGDGTFLPGFQAVSALGLSNSMMQDREGRLVFTSYQNSNFNVVRLNPNASLDPTFGKGGKVEVDMGGHDEAWVSALTPDGKIVIGGYSEPTSAGISARFANSSAAMTRLNPDGTLDISFNGNGKLLLTKAQGRVFDELVVDKLGRVWANVYGATDFKLARVQANGRLDTAFGASGFASVDFGGIDTAYSIAQDQIGRVVMGGVSDANGDNDFALARLKDEPQIVVDGSSVLEGNSGSVNLPFTVTLSAPSLNTVTVRYATVDGTATSGTDYVFKSGTLTFLPGQTEKRLAVVVNGDTMLEEDESVLLNLSAPTNALLRGPQGISAIVNDDNNR